MNSEHLIRLGDDDDTPLIQGFSDDDPLVEA